MMLETARYLAEQYHFDQKYGEDPYTRHLEDVVEVLQPLVEVLGPEILVVGMLHDALEDTTMTEEDLKFHFGEDIALSISLLTDPVAENRVKRKELLYANFMATPIFRKVQPAAVKCADRLCNQRESTKTSNEKMLRVYVREFPKFIGVFGAPLLEVQSQSTEQLYNELWKSYAEMLKITEKLE